MKMKKPNVQKTKGTIKQKVDDAVACCKLHRSTVIASVAAFVGGLASCIFINKFNDENGQSEKTDERRRWQDDEAFEEATIEYGDASIHGAWFTTEKGGKIFFAEDEDGNLP